MDNTEKIIFLKSCKGIGNVAINKVYTSLLSECNSVEQLKEIVRTKSKINEEELNKAELHTNEVLSTLKEHEDVKTLTSLDPDYPKSLEDLGNNKPPILYYIGDISLLSSVCLGVIGTRKPSDWSKLVENRLIKKVTELISPITILSGLAIGCDTIAHETALEIGVKTIAVLPCGVKNIYPNRNAKLAENITSKNGLIISEYEPFEETNKYSFIARDKIVAALSNAIIAIEFGEKSGTMVTVKAGHNLQRKIGVYYPTDLTLGDYSGNIKAINELRAFKLEDTEELKEFCQSLELKK